MKNDIHYMKEALKQAKKAESLLEVPVGAIVVKDNIIISRGYNKRELCQDATCHAEVIAIKKACKKLNSWRLSGCTLYVTLEPCIMCSGTIINSRIERVVFGAFDVKGGALGSVIDINNIKAINHHPQITSGILKDECSSILSNFFLKLRGNNPKSDNI